MLRPADKHADITEAQSEKLASDHLHTFGVLSTPS